MSHVPQVNPVLANILHKSGGGASSTKGATAGTNVTVPGQEASFKVAKAAAGRGVRHSYVAPVVASAASEARQSSGAGDATAALNAASFAFPEPSNPAADSLSLLTSTYQNSLNDMSTAEALAQGTDPTPLNEMQPREEPTPSASFTGFLSRDSSLVDLAMIPSVEEGLPPCTDSSKSLGLSFVDFPHPDVYPSSLASQDKDTKGSNTGNG